jgi:hypothetical protein
MVLEDLPTHPEGLQNEQESLQEWKLAKCKKWGIDINSIYVFSEGLTEEQLFKQEWKKNIIEVMFSTREMLGDSLISANDMRGNSIEKEDAIDNIL